MGDPENEAQPPAADPQEPGQGAESQQPEPEPGPEQPAPPDDGDIKPENTWEG
jgi:hypothetical protein